MSTNDLEGVGDGSTREQVSVLLRRLRGTASIADVARLLPPGNGSLRETSSPQAWTELERGWHERTDQGDAGSRRQIANPTLHRLEEIGRALGVRFAVVAIDAKAGTLVDGQAPALVEATGPQQSQPVATPRPWRQGRTRCAQCGGRSVPANPDGSIATHKVLPYRGFTQTMPDGSVAVRCDGKGRLKGLDGRWVQVEPPTGEPRSF